MDVNYHEILHSMKKLIGNNVSIRYAKIALRWPIHKVLFCSFTDPPILPVRGSGNIQLGNFSVYHESTIRTRYFYIFPKKTYIYTHIITVSWGREYLCLNGFKSD